MEKFRGDTLPDVILVTKNESPANLTGATVVFTLSSERNPVDISKQLYQLVGTIDDPLSGVVVFSPTLDNVDRVGLYYYDVQLTTAEGKVATIDKGVYQYIQDITK